MDLDQVEAFGWRGRAAGAAVTGGERTGDVVGTPASKPDQLERTGHVAHLVMQERACLRLDMDLITDAAEVERVERPER